MLWIHLFINSLNFCLYCCIETAVYHCLMSSFSAFILVYKLMFYSMNMVKSRLLSRNTLSSTVIGVVPQEPTDNQVNVTSFFNLHVTVSCKLLQYFNIWCTFCIFYQLKYCILFLIVLLHYLNAGIFASITFIPESESLCGTFTPSSKSSVKCSVECLVLRRLEHLLSIKKPS